MRHKPLDLLPESVLLWRSFRLNQITPRKGCFGPLLDYSPSEDAWLMGRCTEQTLLIGLSYPTFMVASHAGSAAQSAQEFCHLNLADLSKDFPGASLVFLVEKRPRGSHSPVFCQPLIYSLAQIFCPWSLCRRARSMAILKPD